MNTRDGERAAPRSRPLILTTRPAAQAAGLAAALEGCGVASLNFPVIAIAPAPAEPLRALDLDSFALAFFVSPNAVEQAFALRARAAWPAGLAVAAVGPGSARALQAHGWPEVIAPVSGFDSEAVLALPAFAAQAVAGRKVLVVRGDGGRELLSTVLRERGAEVVQVSVYQRSCADLDPAPVLELAAQGQLGGLVFSASEGLDCFLRITGEPGRALLRTLPCFAPHPRIRDSLLAAGAAQVLLTGAGDAGIAAGVAGFLQQGGFAPSGATRTRD